MSTQEQALLNYYNYLEGTDKFIDIHRQIDEASKAGKFWLKFPYAVSFDAGEKQYFKDKGFSLTLMSLQGTGYVLSWLGRELYKQEI